MRKLALASVLLFLLPACSAMEAVRGAAGNPRIDVVYCRLAPSDDFVDVRFRIYGSETIDPDPGDTYLIDEGTGEKFYIMLLQRIGQMAETGNPEEKAAHSITFRNLDRKLKPGARVTLVVGGMRQKHVVVGK